LPHHITQRGNGRAKVFDCDLGQALVARLEKELNRWLRRGKAGRRPNRDSRNSAASQG